MTVLIPNIQITVSVLERLSACQDGIDWWVRNGLDGFPASHLKDITGDYMGYISWLRSRLYGASFDERGN